MSSEAPGPSGQGKPHHEQGLASSAAREHVVMLWVLAAGLMLINLLIVAPVLADLRERMDRVEHRAHGLEVEVECLDCPDLPAAYRRASCHQPGTCP